jgi:hypothetical protein
MTSSSPSLPDPGSLTRRLDGHTFNLIAVAANRWSVAEIIGHVLIGSRGLGYGEIAALNGGYIITTPTGSTSRGELWPELLEDYLHSAA